MKVKAQHPLKEIIGKSLFGITRVPPEEQERMVNRACILATVWHKENKIALLTAYKDLVKECIDNFVYLPEGRMTAEEYYSEELELIKEMEESE